jgi:PAS domain S-box-containing protein
MTNKHEHNMSILSSLVDSIPDIVLFKDLKGVYLGCNNHFAQLMGYPKEEIIGKTDYELIGQSEAKFYSTKDKDVLTSTDSVQYTDWITYPDGRKALIETRKTPFSDVNGKIIGIIAVGRDITNWELAQNELVAQSELQHILMKIATKYINVPLSDIANTIHASLGELATFVNADRCCTFIYDRDLKIGKNTHEWVANGIKPQIQNLQNVPFEILNHWIEVHDTGNYIYIPDVSSLPVENEIRYLLSEQNIKSLITIPMMDNNSCIGFVGFDFINQYYNYNKREEILLTFFAQILVNINLRVSLEKNLIAEKQNAEYANKVKSEFLANISHEIRTPINAILGFSEALQFKLKDPEDQKMVKHILESGNLLMGLLNDVLDLSKIESGLFEIVPNPVNLKSLFKETVIMFRENVKHKNLHFSIDIEEPFPDDFLLDEIRVKQVVFNLLGNAVKYTESGQIIIKASFKLYFGQFGILKIQIIDTGIGIAEEQLESIFDAFKQYNSDHNQTNKGVGLGLSISKKIIEKMKGTISVQSSVGIGSTFTISIPNVQFISADKNKTSKSEHLKPELLNTYNTTIMVVDDVFLNTELINKLLTPLGFHVLTANSGELALSILETQKPDLILLDMRMPGLSGFEVAEIIKQNDHYKQIPIIAFTASVFNSEKILENGNFDGFLFKPVKRDELLKTIEKFTTVTPDIQIDTINTNFNDIPLYNAKIEPLIDDQSIVHLFEQLFSEWKQIQTNFIIFKVEHFAENIKIIGQNFQFEKMQLFAENTLNLINDLNIDDLKLYFSKFPEIIKEIKPELNLDTNE